MGRVLASTYLYVYTVLHFGLWFLGLVVVWLLSFAWDGERRWVHRYMGLWCWVYIALNPFWRFRIEGREHLESGPYVLAANHQSMLDIVVLYALRYRFKWVAKRELFSMPFFGWILHLGRYVSIDRGSRSDAGRMQRECVGHLTRGTSVMIFPEGTRSRSGRVGAFRVGAFSIAQSAGVAVVPIAVSGPRETLQGMRFAPRRVCMRIRVLPAVHVGEKDVRAVAEEVGGLVAREHRAMAPYFYS